MLIVDAHEDLGWVSFVLGRDLALPVDEIRKREGMEDLRGGTATVSLPALRDGGVKVVFATLFATPYGEEPPDHRVGYRTPEEAFAQAERQIALYHSLEEAGEATVIRSSSDLDNVVSGKAPTPGLVILMEGADPIVSPADLEWFVEKGLRIVGPAWANTRYSSSSYGPGPLTPLGFELLGEMERLGVALDVSHMAEEAFWQAMDAFHGPVAASHSNCRSIIPKERHLTDEQIEAITGRGGMIGMVLYNAFMRPGWRYGDPKSEVSLADILPHIEHIAELCGLDHIGIGTDIDGTGGLDALPAEMDSAADLHKLADVLRSAGCPEPAVEGIMGENWLRWLRGVLR